jgi:hypothetical protein
VTDLRFLRRTPFLAFPQRRAGIAPIPLAGDMDLSVAGISVAASESMIAARSAPASLPPNIQYHLPELLLIRIRCCCLAHDDLRLNHEHLRLLIKVYFEHIDTFRDLVQKEREMGLYEHAFSDKLMSALGNSVRLRSTLFYDIATCGSSRRGES